MSICSRTAGGSIASPALPATATPEDTVIKASKVNDQDEDDFLPKLPDLHVQQLLVPSLENYLKKGKLRNFRHFNNCNCLREGGASH